MVIKRLNKKVQQQFKNKLPETLKEYYVQLQQMPEEDEIQYS